MARKQWSFKVVILVLNFIRYVSGLILFMREKAILWLLKNDWMDKWDWVWIWLRLGSSEEIRKINGVWLGLKNLKILNWRFSVSGFCENI